MRVCAGASFPDASDVYPQRTPHHRGLAAGYPAWLPALPFVPASERFAVATHILALLSLQPDRRMTSASIATSVTTNPVVVRRLLGALRRADLVEVSPGPHGGATLHRAPETITLGEVYAAVEHGHVITLHPSTNHECPVARRITTVLGAVAVDADTALREHLARMRVSDVVARLQAAEP